MSTLKCTNLQHASAASPSIVLAADGSATAQLSSINGGPLAGFRNTIINGNFDIWQRGTSFTDVDGYTADRWRTIRSGSTRTLSRQAFTAGQSDVPGNPTYFCRSVVTSSAGAGNFVCLLQRIEGVRTFAGEQVALSFWAKADATKSIAIEFAQSFGGGGSPSGDVNAIGVTKILLGTSWQKFTVVTTIPSISGKTIGTDGSDVLDAVFWFDAGSNYNSRTDTLGQQSGTFDIAQVQLELGPVATQFERRPIGMELSLCQRYYQHYSGLAAFATCTTGDAATANRKILPIEMRAAPTVSVAFASGSGSSITATKLAISQSNLHTTNADATTLTLSAEL